MQGATRVDGQLGDLVAEFGVAEPGCWRTAEFRTSTANLQFLEQMPVIAVVRNLPTEGSRRNPRAVLKFANGWMTIGISWG
jgi:hypothetical protein